MKWVLYFYAKSCNFTQNDREAIINKQMRQRFIRELIMAKEISSQEELSHELREMGVEVTQATLSRDLHELRIVRMPKDNGFRYELPLENNGRQIQKVVQQEILQVLNNESCIMVRTLPGRAAGVAVFIDSIKHPHIMGTVAGNDTLLVIPTSSRQTDMVAEYLRALEAE